MNFEDEAQTFLAIWPRNAHIDVLIMNATNIENQAGSTGVRFSIEFTLVFIAFTGRYWEIKYTYKMLFLSVFTGCELSASDVHHFGAWATVWAMCHVAVCPQIIRVRSRR